MGLFSRTPAALVAVTPESVRRRQTVTATVITDKPIDKVSSATLEWGYTNFYRYRWAGRADSMATGMNDVWWLMGEVGTDAGSERDTDDWVCVTKVELPAPPDGQFTGGTSSFKVPSWAPGSSDELAQWACRLVIDRGGRDVDTHGVFRVLIGRDDAEFDEDPPRRTAGDGETDLTISVPSPVFVAGETITGSVVLTPRVDMSDGELGIHWGYRRISHPVTRTPAAGGGKCGDRVKLGKGIPLRNGSPVTVPFAVPLPADAPPTGEAVHSSLVWYLEATLMYSKWTQGIEQVRRQIAVVSAP